MDQSLSYYSFVLRASYFLTSLTMPDPQTSDMRQIREIYV